MHARLFRFPLIAALALAAIAGAWLMFARQGAVDAADATTPVESADRGDRPEASGGGRPRVTETYLRELMRRYALETELDKRGALLATLQAHPNADVKAFALALAASRDSTTRQEGLELLKAFPLNDATVRGFLVDQIDQERDPTMLAKLVDMLSPTMIASEDAAPIVTQLTRLRAHRDPEVRAASVLQTSQWDRSAGLEDTLREAMLDPDPRVRLAAIGGITAERMRSDRLKDMLLAIAYDSQTGSEERNRALFALEGFALNRAEYEIYRQAVQRDAAEDRHSHSH